MKTPKQGPLFDKGDENPGNHSPNPHLIEVAMLSRRQLLTGGAALGALAFIGATVPGLSIARSLEQAGETTRPGRLNFNPVPVLRSDSITVPTGYRASTLIPWGSPISGREPAFKPDASNNARDQLAQIGMHHDGMHFFPIDTHGDGKRSDHGLLTVNHEYVDPILLHPAGPTVLEGKRQVADEVRKEIAAHGVSVVEIRRDKGGRWSLVPGGRNRRVTASTPMHIEGPARGHALLKTRYSPSGTTTRGTLNNCSAGATPWGTYLTCEENWAGYFASRETELPRQLARYGVRDSGRYGWETLAGDEFERFDATPRAIEPTGDYRNEPNTFGWVVEIDPFDPDSTPVKRTALGRFAHEGVVFAPVRRGQPVVCYSGDDSQNEYIYKYVSRDAYRSQPHGGTLLDDGTLYVARFNADGSGDWLPLDSNDPQFRSACESAGVKFANQGEVLINTRLAADAVGATKMDRPEWGAINPENGEVYFTLTNNTARTEADAANPRSPNPYGHIVRWREIGDGHAGTRFTWSIYLLSGNEEDSRTPAGPALDAVNRHASPDGLWFDPDGRLWIQTDMSGDQLETGPFGNNQMLVSDPVSGEIKRFLVAPVGAEVTGIASTPDFRTLFVNIQHPGEGSTLEQLTSHWPDGNQARPRSATVVITRNDGKPLL